MRSAKQRRQGVGPEIDAVDVAPTVRVPFTKWQFLTVNSPSPAWHVLDARALTTTSSRSTSRIARRYYDLQTSVTGPVFNRIWTPKNGYAEKFKHDRAVTSRPARAGHHNFNHIVQLDYVDLCSGTTQFTYALDQPALQEDRASREIASVAMMQTYYTDENARRSTTGLSRHYGDTQPSNFGAVILGPRAPRPITSRPDFRAEWDPTAHAFKTFASNGTAQFSATGCRRRVAWSQRRYIAGLPGYNDPAWRPFLNATANVQPPEQRSAAPTSFNYDLQQDTLPAAAADRVLQRAVLRVRRRYQTFNFSGLSTRPGARQDHRFNSPFTLAGHRHVLEPLRRLRRQHGRELAGLS